jgi:hypothetical protein
MPLVEVGYRAFTTDELTGAGAYPGYDTGIGLHAGDLVMVTAHAQWNFSAQNDARFTTGPDQYRYALLRNDKGELWWTADGSTVEVDAPSNLATMLLPDHPHCALVGWFTDPNGADDATRLQRVFPLGSRGSHIVTLADAPAGASSTLKLGLNDTAGAGDYADNAGWCECWIAVYRRQAAQ